MKSRFNTVMHMELNVSDHIINILKAIAVILIVLFLVAFGFYMYNITSGYRFENKLNSMDVRSVNSKFEQFFGDSISSKRVRNLLAVVHANNNQKDTDAETKTIYINLVDNKGKSQVLSPAEALQKITDKKDYKVYLENKDISKIEPDKGDSHRSYYSNGYIRVITIEVN